MTDRASDEDAGPFIVRPTGVAGPQIDELSAEMKAELCRYVTKVTESPLAMLTRQSLPTPNGRVDVFVFTYMSEVEPGVVVRVSFANLVLAGPRSMTLVALSTVRRPPR